MKRVKVAWIVDDDDGDVFLAKHYLGSSEQYEVICVATDGLEALQRLEDRSLAESVCPGGSRPDVIFLDINMPRMNGLEFLERASQLGVVNETTVVVMLTSSALDQDFAEAKKYDFVRDYLVKPISAEAAQRVADRFGSEE